MDSTNNARKLHVRVSEDLHRRLRVRCAERGITIQACVVDLLEKEFREGNASVHLPRTKGSLDDDVRGKDV